MAHPRWADFDAWAALRRENADYLKPWEPTVSDLGLNRVAYRGFGRGLQYHAYRAEHVSICQAWILDWRIFCRSWFCAGGRSGGQ